MKTIEELAVLLVARRSEAASLRREQRALYEACEEPCEYGDGSDPGFPCYWTNQALDEYCPSCRRARAMEPQRAEASKAKRNAMSALTRAVKRKLAEKATANVTTEEVK